MRGSTKLSRVKQASEAKKSNTSIMQILNIILASILFFLPAYIANAMPVIASGLKLFPSLAKPINKKVLGESKTYRGFFVGIIGALVLVICNLPLVYTIFQHGKII